MSSTLGKLYIVGTPIGNMKDITIRALEVLKSVDIILCEDTRTTGILLKEYDISNKNDLGHSKLMSFHSHSKLTQVSKIRDMIQGGKNLALVSDAGTPCISDPGVMLIAELKKEFGNGFEVIAIPGPSALISALSISGIPTHEFVFKGFVPHKKGRETFFHEIAETEGTVVFYESVHRILKTLESLEKEGADRTIMIARELTKMFEETISGTPRETLGYFIHNPEKLRGEFVVVVAPKK